LTVIAFAEGWEDIEKYGKAKEELAERVSASAEVQP
jgi:hypothetical protein